MKRLAITILSALVAAATNLAEVDIFNEETEENINMCANPYSRWKHSSNAWAVYRKYLTQTAVRFTDNGF